MAGTLPRTQAGSQQYNPVGLEVGNLCQPCFIVFTTILTLSSQLLTQLVVFSDAFSYLYFFTWAGSLPCEQQGEVDQWDRRGDNLR